MTSAERAKEIAANFFRFLSASGSSVSESQQDCLVRDVERAITQAQNDKLEEAARWADEWIRQFGGYDPEHISAQRWAGDAVGDIAAQIRSLKSKD